MLIEKKDEMLDKAYKMTERTYRDIGVSRAKQFVLYCLGASIILVAIGIFIKLM